MWEPLFEHIARQNVTLTEAEKTLTASFFSFKRLRKNQYLLQDGDIARYETFVLKGLTRTYQLDDQGQEHVLFFSPEGWWVGDLYSFLSQSPTLYNIDCLEDVKVLQITKANLDELYEQVPQMNKYFRILLQNAFITATERVSASLSKLAIERYQEFLDRYPGMEQRIPNHQIASFLGITPQSLARVRRQLLLG